MLYFMCTWKKSVARSIKKRTEYWLYISALKLALIFTWLKNSRAVIMLLFKHLYWYCSVLKEDKDVQKMLQGLRGCKDLG